MMRTVRSKDHAKIESYIRRSGPGIENIRDLLQMQISNKIK